MINHMVFLCLDSMSKTAMAVPVVMGFCVAYPDVEVFVVTRKKYFPLFEGSVAINMVEYDEDGGLKGFLRLRNMFVVMEDDALVDFTDNLYSRLLCRSLMPWQCKTASVDYGREGKKMLARKFRKVFVQQKPVVDRYVEVLAGLGFEVTPQRPDRSGLVIDEPLAEKEKKSGVWIGVAPFAASNGKTYPLRQSDKLIGLLAEKCEKVFVFGRGKYEQQFAEAMEQRHEKVVAAIDICDLRSQMNLMSHMDAMVVMDSAPMHIAALLGVKTVSVWGATHPYAGSKGWGQPDDSVIQLDMACRPCSVNGTNRCMFNDFACMNGITPEMIVEAVSKQMSDK